jgi:hypothetical protein
MRKRNTVIVILLCSIWLVQAENITLSGTVKNSGIGVAGVKVSLVKYPNVFATTDTQGAFSIVGVATAIQINSLQVEPFKFSLNGNTLVFSRSSKKMSANIEVLSGNGRKNTSIQITDIQAGRQSVVLPKFSSGLNIVCVTINGQSYTCPVIRLGDDFYLKNKSAGIHSSDNFTIARQSATSGEDTLLAQKTGYTDKKTPINAYVQTGISIMIDSGSSSSCTIPAMPSASSLTVNTKMPDPFKFMDGHRMIAKSDWLCRREEIKALAYEFIYGPKPPKPEKVEASFNGKTLTVTCTHNGKTGSFSLDIAGIPSGEGPFPAFITFGSMAIMSIPAGIASMVIPEQTISSEANPRPPKGVFNTLYPEYNNNTGSLIGWAWGISRIIDALEMTPAAKIDPKKIGLMGCSRWGKGAGMGIFDDRVALVVPLSPGSGLVSTWRVAQVQTTSVQTASEIYGEQSWMGTNFKNYGNNNVTKLPIDQHEIIAMCAPRPILVLEGTSDSWNCPTAVYHCMKYAKMVYEALGIPDYIGFSHPAHGHCAASSNATSQAYFKAFCDRFLLGKSTSTAGMFTDSFTFDKSKWQDGELPTLVGDLPAARYDKE